jgi:RimJ/RimL family protein N-acetyltransferase
MSFSQRDTPYLRTVQLPLRDGVGKSKYLMLRHAFEAHSRIWVPLKTDTRHERSQNAIERIGAVEEGVFRNHMILPDGRYRHSVFYSILATEWPRVKQRLEAMMNR